MKYLALLLFIAFSQNNAAFFQAPSPGGLSITRVSVVKFDSAGGGSSTINSPAHNHVAGHGLIVLLRDGNGNAATAVTDTAGDTFTYVSGAQQGGSGLWYTCNTAGNSSNIVTATFTASNGYDTIAVVEIAGQYHTGCLDQSTTAAAVGTATITSNSFTDSQANEYSIAQGVNGCTGGSWSAGTAYSMIAYMSTSGVGFMERTNAPSGAQTASMTFNGGTCTNGMSVVSFQ